MQTATGRELSFALSTFASVKPRPLKGLITGHYGGAGSKAHCTYTHTDTHAHTEGMRIRRRREGDRNDDNGGKGGADKRREYSTERERERDKLLVMCEMLLECARELEFRGEKFSSKAALYSEFVVLTAMK